MSYLEPRADQKMSTCRVPGTLSWICSRGRGTCCQFTDRVGCCRGIVKSEGMFLLGYVGKIRKKAKVVVPVGSKQEFLT